MVKGSGEKSAVWGLGALAIDSLMLVGCPGGPEGYEASRAAASVGAVDVLAPLEW